HGAVAVGVAEEVYLVGVGEQEGSRGVGAVGVDPTEAALADPAEHHALEGERGREARVERIERARVDADHRTRSQVNSSMRTWPSSGSGTTSMFWPMGT